jgi:1-acyl-sn-glycerol-3-phosphate acyltransferase
MNFYHGRTMWPLWISMLAMLIYAGVGLLITTTAIRVRRLPQRIRSLEQIRGLEESWKPFIRYDDNRSPFPNAVYTVIWCVLLGPCRLFMCIILVLVPALATLVFEEDRVAVATRWASRTILSTLRIQLRVKGTRAATSDAPLMVGNHVAATDILALLSIGGSFVAKDGVLKIPAIGTVAAAIGCIFVGRDSPASRSSARDLIAERLRAKMQSGNDAHPLVIFPEGTTTNGHGVIEFRRGSFESCVPFQPVRIEYSDPQYSMAMLDTLSHICVLCAMPGCELTLTYLPVIRPNAGDSSAAQATRAREALIKGTSLERFGLQSHRDEDELMSYISRIPSTVPENGLETRKTS